MHRLSGFQCREGPLSRQAVSLAVSAPAELSAFASSATPDAPPRGKSAAGVLAARDVQAVDAAASAHLLGDEFLIGHRLDRLLGDLVGQVGGNDDQADAIAEQDIA